jgi:hypothetical protein
MKKILTFFLILFSISTIISAKENSTIIGNKEKKITIEDIQRIADRGNPEALNAKQINSCLLKKINSIKVK